MLYFPVSGKLPRKIPNRKIPTYQTHSWKIPTRKIHTQKISSWNIPTRVFKRFVLFIIATVIIDIT